MLCLITYVVAADRQRPVGTLVPAVSNQLVRTSAVSNRRGRGAVSSHTYVGVAERPCLVGALVPRCLIRTLAASSRRR